MAQQNKIESLSSSSSSSSTSTQRASIGEKLRWRLAGHARYEDFELLLSDKNLWALMMVPFSPELAERTQQVSVADKTAVEDHAQVEVVSKDRRTIREAIARELDKAPSQLVDADYENVTVL
ncbi:MAG: hypothetical protein ACYTE3_30390, partial [Planctomycetota bacterium]